LENVIERIAHSENVVDSTGTAILDESKDKELFQKMLDAELNKIEKFYLRQVIFFPYDFILLKLT
jgi:hypothetical protein